MNAALFVLIIITLFAPQLPDDACNAPAAKKTAGATAQAPFACNILALTPEIRVRHFLELGPMLRSLRTGVRELPDGYEFSFPSDPKTFALLTDWTEQERLCCPFFNIELQKEREGGPVWLRLTGRHGTKGFIRAGFGSWIRQ
jgi:hypothetical protein